MDFTRRHLVSAAAVAGVGMMQSRPATARPTTSSGGGASTAAADASDTFSARSSDGTVLTG